MSNALVISDLNTALMPTQAGSLEQYIQSANMVPMLTAEQEHDLAVRLRDHNDLEAARQLVMSHMRFVIRIARGYNGYGLPLADLVQEGNIGLMKAVRRFNPEFGVRLVSFAVHWIRAEMHEFILRNWRIVKVATTKAQRKLFFNLRSSKKRLGWLSHEEVQAVAKDLGVEPKTVLEMESRLSGQDVGYDLGPTEDDDDAWHSPAAYLQAPTNSDPGLQVEQDDQQQYQLDQLGAAMATLDQRSKDILSRRWLTEDKTTLQELANEYGVSAERIRQLENNAIKKIKAHMVA